MLDEESSGACDTREEAIVAFAMVQICWTGRSPSSARALACRTGEPVRVMLLLGEESQLLVSPPPKFGLILRAPASLLPSELCVGRQNRFWPGRGSFRTCINHALLLFHILNHHFHTHTSYLSSFHSQRQAQPLHNQHKVCKPTSHS